MHIMQIRNGMLQTAQDILGKNVEIVEIVNDDDFIGFRTALSGGLESVVTFWYDQTVTLHVFEGNRLSYFEAKDNFFGHLKLLTHRLWR